MKRIIASSALVLGFVTAAHAVPVTYFGENLTPGGTVNGDPLTAQSEFLSQLTGVGVEGFENGAVALSFPGSAGDISATLSGSQTTLMSSPLAGTFATSGSNFILTEGGGDFTVDFDTGISAFGFYGTDIGDINNSLLLSLTDTSGVTTNLEVGNSTDAPTGSLLFFGFIDDENSYDSISFFNQPNGSDGFGFDDLVVGDLGQIDQPSPVPLPAAGWFLVLSLLGFGGLRRMQTT
jgi:hypothetical protein